MKKERRIPVKHKSADVYVGRPDNAAVRIPWYGGGATVFAARGKRLCRRPKGQF